MMFINRNDNHSHPAFIKFVNFDFASNQYGNFLQQFFYLIVNSSNFLMDTAIFIRTLLRDMHIYILRTHTSLPGLSFQSFIHPLFFVNAIIFSKRSTVRCVCWSIR